MNNDLTPLSRFLRLLQPDKKEIRNVYIYAIFNGLVGLSLPLGIQAIVNLIQGGQISTSWIVLVVFVVLGVAVTGILQIFQLRITENLQQKIFTRAAFEFSYRIPRIKLEALYKYHAPELMNRFFDVISVQKGLSKIILDFSSATLQVLFGLILLSFYHPFFIFFGLILLILIYAIFKFTAKKGLESSLIESNHKYRLVHWLEELARTANTFKLSGKSTLPLIRTDQEVNLYLNARERHFSILVRQYSLMVLFKVIVATGLLAIGGILVMEQVMNIGQFIAAEIIILMVIASVEKLILNLETIYDVLTSLEKVGQVTDLQLDEEDGIDIESQSKKNGLKVELRDVAFSFPTQTKEVINNINYSIENGKKIVLTGHNASGKSTLIQLIAGLYNPTSGYIAYEGERKSNIKLSSLHSIIGDSLNQEVLFEGSIYENISLGREDVSREAAEWALNNIGLKDFMMSLPKGLDTKIEPFGKRFPRSIIQKLLLARSISNKPRLLLIEDSLEHLDKNEREKIAEFLFHPSRDWTLVMISNDPNIIQRADECLELENGSLKNVTKINNK